jgi:RNA polymerase sigma-70 factor (ECF subfamily)
MENNLVFSSSSLKSVLQSDSSRLESLLEDAKSGKDAAFSKLYELYFDKIYRFAFYRVSHKEVAEDITEEVFIRAFTSLSSLDKASSFESWLYQIARNRIIDYYRAKKQLLPLDDLENTLEYETNIIDSVNLQFDQKIFLKVLRELPADQQTIIRLKFYEDLSNTEIADMTGKTEGAIRVLQHRALTKLKELIDAQNLSNE